MPSVKDIVIVLIASILLGLVGAIPFGILAFIVGNADSARDMYLIEALLIGSWFPLKLLVDSVVKGQMNFKLPQFSINQLSIFIVIVAAIPLLILLYFNTVFPFAVAALTYRFSEGNILSAVIFALGLQLLSIYRSAQREKAMGTNNNFFVRFQDMNDAGFSVNLDPSQVRQQTPREDVPEIIYLPEDNLRDRSMDTTNEQPMTINIDPDAVSEQSDDET